MSRTIYANYCSAGKTLSMTGVFLLLILFTNSFSTMLDSGKIYFFNKEYEHAYAFYNRALAKYPDSMQLHRHLQDACIALGDSIKKTTLATYRARYTTDPGNPQSAYLYGRCLPCSEGKPLFEKALSAKPCYSWAQNALGACLFEEGKIEKAKEIFSETMKCDPDFGEAYKNLAMIYIQAQQHEPAKKVFRALIGRNRANPTAYEWIGDMYMSQKQYAYSKKAYEKAIEYGGTDPGLFFKLGYCFFEEKTYPEAAEKYKESIKRGNHDYKVYYNLASVQELLNQPEQAIENYDIAFQKSKNDSICYSIGNCAVLLGLHTKAIQSYQRFLKKNPENLEALLGLANSYQMRKEFKTAIETYHAIIDKDSTFLKAYYNLGSIYAYHSKDLQKMNLFWGKFLEISPKNEEAEFIQREMMRFNSAK